MLGVRRQGRDHRLRSYVSLLQNSARRRGASLTTAVHRRRGRLRYKVIRGFVAPASPRAMVLRPSIPAAVPNFARGSRLTSHVLRLTPHLLRLTTYDSRTTDAPELTVPSGDELSNQECGMQLMNSTRRNPVEQ